MIFLMETHREKDVVRSMFDILLFDLITGKQNSDSRWIVTTEGVHYSPRVKEHEERPETLKPSLKVAVT